MRFKVFCKAIYYRSFHFDDDELVIKANTTAKDIDGWDSLTHIRLVISIEKAFDLRFTAAEISALENVGEMVELIVKLS